jgi:CheY-like chemotaxis protein
MDLGNRSPVPDDESTVRQVSPKPGVLVVDDDRLVRIVLQLGLERHGFEVWLAANGPEAIELYRQHQKRIAAVLLDVRMMGLDGPHTLDALRELNPEVRACFMSGDMGGYCSEELLERGAAHVIEKPFFLQEIATILRLLVRCATEDLLAAGSPIGTDGYHGDT